VPKSVRNGQSNYYHFQDFSRSTSGHVMETIFFKILNIFIYFQNKIKSWCVPLAYFKEKLKHPVYSSIRVFRL